MKKEKMEQHDNAEGTNRTEANLVAPEDQAIEENSSSSTNTYVSVVDEEYYNKYCKEVEITDKIDMGMIVDFVQNQQTF